MLPAPEHLGHNPPYERVILAILGLADGDMDRLSEFSRAAMADWRDVLYWWETPELAEAASGRVHELLEKVEDSDD